MTPHTGTQPPAPDVRRGALRRWTLYVCDKGHVEHGTLRGVCWACYPGGRRTWEPGEPRQEEPNQEPVEVISSEDVAALLREVVEGLSRANQSAAAFGLVTRLAQAGIDLDPASAPTPVSEEGAGS